MIKTLMNRRYFLLLLFILFILYNLNKIKECPACNECPNRETEPTMFEIEKWCPKCKCLYDIESCQEYCPKCIEKECPKKDCPKCVEKECPKKECPKCEKRVKCGEPKAHLNSDIISLKQQIIQICPKIAEKFNFRESNMSKIRLVDNINKKFEKWKKLWTSNKKEEFDAFCYPYKYTELKLKELGKNLKMCVWNKKEEIVSEVISSGKIWEPHVLDSMLENLVDVENAVVFDIGGHVGQFTIIAAALGANVVTFEAMPEHSEMIQRSLFLNNITENVLLFNNGIYYTSQTFYLVRETENEGSAYLSEKEVKNQSIPIECVTFDTVLPFIENRIGSNFKVNFLKADIEGSETFFIMGAEKLFLYHDIEKMSIEIAKTQFYNGVCDITNYLKFFEMMGYNVKFRRMGDEPMIYIEHGKENSRKSFYDFLMKTRV